MSNINIEIQNSVMKQLNIKYSKKELNLEHIPFNNFSITCVRNKEESEKVYHILLDDLKQHNIPITPGIKAAAVNRSQRLTNNYNINNNVIRVWDDDITTVYKLAKPVFKVSDDPRKILDQLQDVKVYDNRTKQDMSYRVFSTEQGMLDVMRNLITLNGIVHYFNAGKDKIKVVKERKPLAKNNKSKKKSKKKNNVTYISKTKYIIDNYDPDIERREYNLTAESWPVRGHWRTLRSGKKVWIKGYTKNPGSANNKEVEDKVYKIRG